MTLNFDLENYPHILSPWLNMWLFMKKTKAGYGDLSAFDMILTFDLEDHIGISFLVVDYVVVHVLIPYDHFFVKYSNLSIFVFF